MPTEPRWKLTTLHEGAPTPPMTLPGGSKAVAVGVGILSGGSTLGSAVFRVELAIPSEHGGTDLQWFDAGTSLDLSASTTTLLVPVTGYAGVRVALRTAASDADDLVGVWIGAPIR